MLDWIFLRHAQFHATWPLLGNILLKHSLHLFLVSFRVRIFFSSNGSKKWYWNFFSCCLCNNFSLQFPQPMWVEGPCSVEFDSSSSGISSYSNAKSPPLYPQRVSPHHLTKQPNRAKTPSNSSSDSEAAGPSNGNLASSESESELEVKVENDTNKSIGSLFSLTDLPMLLLLLNTCKSYYVFCLVGKVQENDIVSAQTNPIPETEATFFCRVQLVWINIFHSKQERR